MKEVSLPLSVRDVESAAARLRGSVYLSPCEHSRSLSELTGNEIYLKLENLQMTGSFKERGALNKLLTLTKDQRACGVIAASAGNHAQGVAYHASRLGIQAEIVMPLHTPLVKVQATRRHGAEVVLHGMNYDESCERALTDATTRGLTFVHAFDDPEVIAGQGTIGFEILHQQPRIDVIVAPIGGGGLLGGIACAVKETNPRVKVVGVQTARLPSMIRAMEAGAPVTVPAATTIADGIAVRRAGEKTLPLIHKYVDEIVTVEEEEIASAILLLLEREKTLAEGAGAAGLAALLHNKLGIEGQRVAVTVCGGNIDVTLLSRIIERGLVKDGRLVRLRIHLPDHPGALMKLTAVIAGQNANIVETNHDRAYYGVNLGDTVIDITMETRGREHVDALGSALSEHGYTFERVM
ncbi:MAG: threonine ammonia-lyase [Bryobacterales bacterium]|nr:threonine ammonia-lyase [Bryobacterales bacterium]